MKAVFNLLAVLLIPVQLYAGDLRFPPSNGTVLDIVQTSEIVGADPKAQASGAVFTSSGSVVIQSTTSAATQALLKINNNAGSELLRVQQNGNFIGQGAFNAFGSTSPAAALKFETLGLYGTSQVGFGAFTAGDTSLLNLGASGAASIVTPILKGAVPMCIGSQGYTGVTGGWVTGLTICSAVTDGVTNATNGIGMDLIFQTRTNGNNLAEVMRFTSTGTVMVAATMTVTGKTFSVGGSTATLGNLVVTSTGVYMLGVTDGAAAPAGYVGEISTAALNATQTPPGSTVYVVIATRTFSPGEYIMTGACVEDIGATTAQTRAFCGISSSQASPDAVTWDAFRDESVAPSVNGEFAIPVGPRRVRFNTATTYYLLGNLTYTVLGGATWSTRSGFQAERVR